MQRELPSMSVVRQFQLPGMRRIRAKAGEIEFRYEQDQAQFALSSYSENVETVGHGHVEDLPSWVTDVITLGLIGSHAWGYAPGGFVLWFVTDDSYHLKYFISPQE